MAPKRPQRILAEHSSERLEDRAEQAEKLYLAAMSGGGPRHIRVKGEPGAGTSELLRQTFDRLFREQRFVIPIYFQLHREDRSAETAAQRFLDEFLVQAVAFRRKDEHLVGVSPQAAELKRLAPLPDSGWVDEIVALVASSEAQPDPNAYLRTSLAAPMRAASASGLGVCVIVDDLHNAAAIENGRRFIETLSRMVVPAGSTLFLSSRRNFDVSGSPSRTFTIARPEKREAGLIADSLAAELEVKLTDSVRDLIIASAGGHLSFVRSIISAARDAGRDLTSYREAARIYSKEVADGGIARMLRSDLGLSSEQAAQLDSAAEAGGAFDLKTLGERLSIEGRAFEGLVELLAAAEIIKVAGTTAEVSDEPIIRDFLSAERAVATRRQTPAAVSAHLALSFLRDSPDRMAHEYRRAAAVGLSDLLSAFDGREIPQAAIDYRVFRDRYKGLSEADVRAQLSGDTETYTLPVIVQSSALREFVPQSDLEAERVVAGVGFPDQAFRADDEIVWIAAELDSKLEADPELVREWLDRIDEAARIAGFARHRAWLVTPEGFSPGALDLLTERGAIGSSRRQTAILREIIEGRRPSEAVHEYSMEIPIGDDTELIAVHAVEEIARRAAFPAKSINQIKTALVEACINAVEHSLSPDRKIYLKFASFDDRLVLTVSNRGLRLADRVGNAAPDTDLSTDTRRGWGLGLMRNLMDEVRVEAVDDGTRIVMTKLKTL